MSLCIDAPGYKMPNGYARKWYQGKQQLAHRVAWQQAFGPIPVGLVVMHACDNPACINVDHLILGTQSDNMQDKKAKGRAHRLSQIQTHCRRGHALTPDNDYGGTKDGYVIRRCKVCARTESLTRYHRRKQHGLTGRNLGQLRLSEIMFLVGFIFFTIEVVRLIAAGSASWGYHWILVVAGLACLALGFLALPTDVGTP